MKEIIQEHPAQLVCSAARDNHGMKITVFAFYRDGGIRMFDANEVSSPEFVNEMRKIAQRELQTQNESEPSASVVMGLPTGEEPGKYAYLASSAPVAGSNGVFPFLRKGKTLYGGAHEISKFFGGKKPAEILHMLGSNLSLPKSAADRLVPSDRLSLEPISGPARVSFWRKSLEELRGQAAEEAKKIFSMRILANGFLMGLTRFYRKDAVKKPLFGLFAKGAQIPKNFYKKMASTIETSFHMKTFAGAKERPVDPMSPKMAGMLSTSSRYANYPDFRLNLVRQGAVPRFYLMEGNTLRHVAEDDVRKIESLHASGKIPKPQWQVNIFYRDEMNHTHEVPVEDLADLPNKGIPCLHTEDIVRLAARNTSALQDMNAFVSGEQKEARNLAEEYISPAPK